MPTIDIPTVGFDTLAKDAMVHVFDCMVSEQVSYIQESHLLGKEADGKDLFAGLNGIEEGYFTIAVGFLGDAQGLILLTLTRGLAEKFTLKLLDAPDLQWLGDDVRATLKDTMGELGNMMVGLVKGGLTKWLPNLMLTTPKVVSSSRIKVDASKLHFRKQYEFYVMDSHALVDICCG